MEDSPIPADLSTRSSPFRPGIRSTPRAFILRGGKLLVQEKRHPQKGLYYTLPGGKQDPGESLADTLKRECLEEIGADVDVFRLLHVAEVYRLKTEEGERQHQLDFVFECSVPDAYEPVLGPHPDPHQVATCWLSIDNAQQLRPAYVTKLFSLGCTRDPEVYLGPYND
ncbi:NUDIX domain-containing protein [Roseibium aggregatum]|uniref:NUDIX domain-containing protein n=1 Tax=Roseibium aggregatum TaxID=187304 RepID=UPI0022A80B0C|nr:NUDIX domain-containing protein [Roseibium aggregatum]